MKALQKIKRIVIKIIFFFLNLFFGKKKKENMLKNQTQKENNITKDEKKSAKRENSTQNIPNESPHELKKERNNLDKRIEFNHLELEKNFYEFIEKIFKIKIKDISAEKQQKLKTYTLKILKKVEEEIKGKEIENKKQVENLFKKNLKKDLAKKNIDLDKLIINTETFSLIEKKEVNIEYLKKNEKDEKINLAFKIENNNKKEPIISIPEIQKSVTLDKNNFEKNKNETNNSINLETNADFSIKLTSPIEEKKENIEEEIQKLELLEAENTNEEKFKDEEKIEFSILKNKNYNEVVKQENESLKKDEKVEKETNELNKNYEKMELKKEINLNLNSIELENNQMIKLTKIEIQKEDLMDKNYEKMEELLDERIKEIEFFLQKNLSSIQKTKLENELIKLKETKKQLYFYKEKDIEELRISLEENIPVEELLIISEKLRKLTEMEELDRKKALIKKTEKKAEKEIQEIEKKLIKESFKKTLRRLEIPLFLSFPFIKNKHFRKFVSGLFLFRTFGFIKNLLFGITDIEEFEDLSYIKRGSDALKESITLTEKNIGTFLNLKNETFRKYPELLQDKDFINDMKTLEQKLKNNYEKLLQQEKTVQKYFSKSKVLIRKKSL